MATHFIFDKLTGEPPTQLTGILTCANIYKYKGFLFEFHPYCGPNEVTKTYELRKRISKGFYEAAEEWMNLPEVEQEKYLVAY